MPRYFLRKCTIYSKPGRAKWLHASTRVSPIVMCILKQVVKIPTNLSVCCQDDPKDTDLDGRRHLWFISRIYTSSTEPQVYHLSSLGFHIYYSYNSWSRPPNNSVWPLGKMMNHVIILASLYQCLINSPLHQDATIERRVIIFSRNK